ncbi:right-handed parallel beta-helix repeat-containing protein [Sorangium sp. So ce887]|uniref:right-handed parallel beta-helix repeat-containing protein n=1 Tax=Sorangium sp. So ce887 TaxID=3133324 RepID=UPI003F61D1F9
MLSTQRIVKTWIGAVLALVSAPAAASSGGSSAVWGYHPPTGESAEYPDFCSLDAPYTESAFTADEADLLPCPTTTAPSICKGPFCPVVGGKCAGIDTETTDLHEDSNDCEGEDCCLPGSVADGVVDVLPYLMRPVESPFSADDCVDDSLTVDDSPGIAEAIECAASLTTDRRTVAFPAGRYVLRTPLRPHYDRLTLEGPELSPDAEPGDPGTATLVAIPCNPEQYPGAIQVSRPNEHLLDPVTALWIRNFQIELTDGPRETANSGIRINHCEGCEVENVIMRYAPPSTEVPACKPANLDGITFGGGSGGVIRNVIVDGVPKGGIYLSSVPGLHATPGIVVENCEIKNISGPVGAAGIKIITANVIVRNCEVHHSLLHGSTSYGGHGLWIAAQVPGGLSTIPSVPENVVIQDSYFHHNGGSGVMMASPLAEVRPENISLEGVRSAYNGSYGVHMQAGTNVALEDLWSWGNGYYGVYLTSRTTALPASALRVDNVTLENPVVFNNALRLSPGSHPGIRIEASDVTIDGGEIARCSATRGAQSASIQQKCWKSGLTGEQVVFHPEDNLISGVGAHGTSAPQVLVCDL